MKKLFLSISLGIALVMASVTSAWAWFFEPETPKVHYCDDAGECGLKEGIQVLKWGITDVVTDRSLSQYIQDIVRYLLMFVTIVAVIYVIYAGFQIMVWGWEEEKLKSGKETIKYVLIGIVVMWLAYSIVAWLLKILNLSA